MDPFSRSLLLAVMVVNFVGQHFTLPTRNESALWNAFFQYVSVMKELPSIGLEIELDGHNPGWLRPRYTTPRPPIATTEYPKTSTVPYTTSYSTTRPPTSSPPTLPPYQDTARMARFIVHSSNWGSLAYKAAQSEIEGYPSARVYSISDGYLYAGTGVPYFMVSPLDLTIQALKSNEKCSLILSLSQTSYCSDRNWDPEDPRCVQVILTGRFIWLPNKSDEAMLARRVLWDRHPEMMDWFVNKLDHKWEFAKLEIEFITVIDYFGGRKYPSLTEYFSAEAPEPYAQIV